MQTSISDILYQLVNERGLTADDIADVVKVKPETVGQWLSGIKEPGKDSTTALLAFYKKELEIEGEVTLVTLKDETTVADDNAEEGSVEQTAVHHASADPETILKAEEAPKVDTVTDAQQVASETNNEPEDTANMNENKTTDQEHEGQSIRSKASVFFRKPVVRNAGKAIVGVLILGATAAAGAYGERRRGASTPV